VAAGERGAAAEIESEANGSGTRHAGTIDSRIGAAAPHINAVHRTK
jgi:hypothetical protein